MVCHNVYFNGKVLKISKILVRNLLLYEPLLNQHANLFKFKYWQTCSLNRQYRKDLKGYCQIYVFYSILTPEIYLGQVWLDLSLLHILKNPTQQKPVITLTDTYDTHTVLVSLAQGLEIIYIWLLINFLNIPFFFFVLVYWHGADFRQSHKRKLVSRLTRH